MFRDASDSNQRYNDVFTKFQPLDGAPPPPQAQQHQSSIPAKFQHTQHSPHQQATAHLPLVDRADGFLLSAAPGISPAMATPHGFNLGYRQDNLFTLPSELQGGIGTISSRRPSYAAESFTRATDEAPHFSHEIHNEKNHALSATNNLAAFATANNYSLNFDSLNHSFARINLTSNLNEFQARRPSQLVDFQASYFLPSQYVYQKSEQQQQPQPQAPRPTQQPLSHVPLHASASSSQQQPPFQLQLLLETSAGQAQAAQSTSTHSADSSYDHNLVVPIKLENGLILQDQYIIASPELKTLYSKTTKYFQNPSQTEQILADINRLLQQPTILKMIAFVKSLNNLTFNHKSLCLVINKNGKFDLLSYPSNSNILLQKSDLVIVDGDRGKDLVMILEPLVDLDKAILFNFLKKLEHLKSLTIVDPNAKGGESQQKNKKVSGGTHSTSLSASLITGTHTSEDNEFIITLPTKQVLRFATPKEVHKLSGKFLEEKKAFATCLNKIRELNLQTHLELINVEYQSDFKKLIFYYFAGFKRIDFRGLIKELFKIYKTRIWLCAVLPFDKPELYITQEAGTTAHPTEVLITERSPSEYKFSGESMLKFSIHDFQHLATPNYFHSANLQNLIRHVQNESRGNFYGFNNKNPVPIRSQSLSTPPQPRTRVQAGSVLLAATRKGSLGLEDVPEGSQAKSFRSRHGLASRPPTSKILPNFNPFGDSS